MSANLSNLVECSVHPGDTLSSITRRRYGKASLWPQVARYNNLRRPDLLLAGQKILLPEPSLLEQVKEGIAGFVADHKPAPVVALPAIKFSLDNLMPVTAYLTTPAGVFKITMSLKGELTFQQRGGIKDVSISNLKKIQAKTEAEIRYGMQALTTDVGISFDPEECKLDAKFGLASVLTTPNGSKFTHKVELGWNSVTFSCDVQPAAGHWNGFDIEGSFGYEIVEENYRPPFPKLVPILVNNGLEYATDKLEKLERLVYQVVMPAFFIAALILVVVAIAFLAKPLVLGAAAAAVVVVAFLSALEWLQGNRPNDGGGPQT